MDEYKNDIKQGKLHRGNHDANTRFLKQHVSKIRKKRILEVGCGAGHLSTWLTEQGAKVTGIDLSETLLQHAKKHAKADQFLYMDAQDLEFNNNTFETVVSFDLIEHLPDVQKHMSEVSRVLKDGGYYLFGTPNKIPSAITSIIKNKSLTKHRKSHVSLQTQSSLTSLADQNDFTIHFENVSLMSNFYKNKLRKVYGNFFGGLLIAMNVDRFPLKYKSNFYVVCRKK